jgi:hypothetical protein
MTYSFQIWNGTQWETKFLSTDSKELEAIRNGLEEVGFHAIIVGDGSMPKRPSNLEQSIVQALMEAE